MNDIVMSENKEMTAIEQRPEKVAVFLFNLGGPDAPESVEPFLFNLFNDPAIITLPGWLPYRSKLQHFIASKISRKRAPIAQEIYEHIGGKSPILEQTQAQADALEDYLNRNDAGGNNGGRQREYKCFIAMRYWKPFCQQAVAAAKEWGAERAILLPLYPQFSTTTSGSSLREWWREAESAQLVGNEDAADDIPTHTVCCYYDNDGYANAQAEYIERVIAEHMLLDDNGDYDTSNLRLLFSAHGLPQKIVDAGDPYQFQVEESTEKIMNALRERTNRYKYDYRVCYQSKVGPLKWLEPSTETELENAAEEGKGVLIIPLAFVSEHSETLVELDIEYKELADEQGMEMYLRAPTVGVNAQFIEGLGKICFYKLDNAAGQKGKHQSEKSNSNHKKKKGDMQPHPQGLLPKPCPLLHGNSGCQNLLLGVNNLTLKEKAQKQIRSWRNLLLKKAALRILFVFGSGFITSRLIDHLMPYAQGAIFIAILVVLILIAKIFYGMGAKRG